MQKPTKKRNRVLRTLQQQGSRARAAVGNVNTTLGDLIAATFDTVGDETKMVLALICSADMRRAIGRRIILT